MNEIAIENFINFCDDMLIAEEGFSDTKIYTLIEKGWTYIKETVIKLINKIKSFILKNVVTVKRF